MGIIYLEWATKTLVKIAIADLVHSITQIKKSFAQVVLKISSLTNLNV